MTTIDSDSESQDSDDGRRFRFEATRKDDTLRLQSHSKRRSEQSKPLNYRSRSGERGNHNRRDYDKGRQQERDRKEGGDREKRKSSKERESRDNKYNGKSNSKDSRHGSKGNIKDVKEPHESKTLLDNEKRCGDSRTSKDPVRNSSNSKDYKNSKDSRARESKNSNTRASKEGKIREAKDQDLKSPRDRETKTSRDSETKDRERGPKRSHDASHERISTAKHGHRSREKYKSRERPETNREKGKQLEVEKPKEERNKNLVDKRNPRKVSERKNIKRDTHSPSRILEQIGSDSESDLGALDPDVGPVMALDTFEDCREMNLSDFDIISDTEGSSSDTQDAKLPAKGPIIKGEILTPHYYGPKITKRVSRRQYERLVMRQAALNTRRLEELYKVNRRSNSNDQIAPLDPSNNNPSAVSDFLLGPEAVGEHRRSLNMGGEDKHSDYSSGDQESEDKRDERKRENNHRDSGKLYNLKIEQLRLDNASDREKIKGSLSSKNDHKYKTEELLDRKKIYGPSLPPVYRKEFSSHPEAVSSSSRDKNSTIVANKSRPVSSSKKIDESGNTVIGPSLPPGIRASSESAKSESEESSLIEAEEKSAPIIGPSLPPHLKRENSDSLILPKAPQHNVVLSDNSIFGPTLPPYLVPKTFEYSEQKSDSDSDEEGVLGPLPPDHPAAMNDYIQRQLEERAKRMKDKLDSKNSVVEKREEWMLELPSAQAANLGLGSKRQFRSKAGPDMSDRSSWTDTPADKVRKKQDKLAGKVRTADPAKESERLAIRERDKAMEKMAEKHASKKRKESLVEMHKKKLQKKKKKEEKGAKDAGGKQTRRPFDRDVDLQANRFDEAQKKSILKKAQLLNDRFSRGESKFL